MTDRRQIEGSAERAADRGIADALAIFALMGEKPFLGDPNVIEGLVRCFLGDIVDVRKQWNAGTLADPMAEITGAIERVTAILMGRNADYLAQPWNSAEQLGHYIQSRYGFAEGEAGAVEAFLWLIGRQMLDTAVEHEKGQIDDEVAKFRVETTVEDTVALFLGLSPTGDDA